VSLSLASLRVLLFLSSHPRRVADLQLYSLLSSRFRRVDHKAAYELSGSKVSTPVGNAGKTVADGTAHYLDEKLSDEDQGQRGRRSMNGLTVSMNGGHDGGALQRKALYLARV